MSEVTWKMKTLKASPYTGTVIFGQNEGDQKWVFIRSNCSTVLYADLFISGSSRDKVEIKPYGIAGFCIPTEALHSLVSIGVSIDDSNWLWTYHDYHTGRTTPK